MITYSEFVKKLKDVADNYKTLYVNSAFGAPLNATNKKRYSDVPANAKRINDINKASADTFAFDCSGLVPKAILWGWCGDKKKTYGGAVYCSNGVPDCYDGDLLSYCTEVSTDFNKIVPGELVWMEGHVGAYVGNGKVVECSPKWANGVQYSNLGNIAKFKTGNYREWTKHGKMSQWIDYKGATNDFSAQTTNTTPSTPKTPTVQPTTPTSTFVNLQKGSKGQSVVTLQTNLNKVMGSGLVIDGDFGSLTEKAVKNFQTRYGLGVDGIYGPKSDAKMQEVLKSLNSAQATTKAPTLSRGSKVTCNKAGLYGSSTNNVKANTITGTYYCWDSTIINSRIRITTKSEYVGNPAYVTGWVNTAELH